MATKAQQFQILLEELDRQIEWISIANPAGEAAVVQHMTKQDPSYRAALVKLRDVLQADPEISTDIRSVPLWKVCAFFPRSWFLDPELMKDRSRDLSRIVLRTSKISQAGLKTGNGDNIWSDPQVIKWASTPESSLLVVEGTYATIESIEVAAVDLIEYLEAKSQTVTFVLDSLPRSGRDANLADEPASNFLWQIAVQIIRKNSSLTSSEDLARLLSILSASSHSNVDKHLKQQVTASTFTRSIMQIMPAIVQGMPLIYIVMNVFGLHGRSHGLKNWPSFFVDLFELLPETTLKVILFDSHQRLDFLMFDATDGTKIDVPILKVRPPDLFPRNTESFLASVREDGHFSTLLLAQRNPGELTNKFGISLPIPHVESRATVGPSWNLQDDFNFGEVAGKPHSRYRGDWFAEMQAFEKCVDSARKEPDDIHPRVKIAILDTGLDTSHADIKRAIEEKRLYHYDFVEGKKMIDDFDGHGTHCTSIVAKHAPNAVLYVGRVFKYSRAIESSAAIVAKAIRYAVDVWQVDIVSLSLGFTEYDEGIEKEVERACGQRTLVFAAAANNTINEKISLRFPARMTEVICVFSSSIHGRPSDFNPNPRFDRPNFMFPGENIEGAWPSKRKVEGTYEREGAIFKHQSGTSCATPIAAAVAAGILEFAWQNREPQVRRMNFLKHYRGMSAVLLKMVETHKVGDNSWHYVKPWKLITTNGWRKEEINAILSDTLVHSN